jgi:hypothetical protein
MNKFRLSACAAALVMLGACSHGSNQVADTGLATDLSLAAQQKAFTPNDSAAAANQAVGNVAATTPAASATVHHASTARTHHSSASGSTGSSGTYASAPAPAPTTTVVKHTKRDAAIGAGAGAVIGAVTSRDKVKGGLIGAAAGAILGGVIGNNVDITRKP